MADLPGFKTDGLLGVTRNNVLPLRNSILIQLIVEVKMKPKKKRKKKVDIKDKILSEGTKVKAEITSCKMTDNPNDDEHTVFQIGFQYKINGEAVKKSIIFSINTMHIEYAHIGQLFGVPKLKYSLNDFIKSLKPGEVLDVISLDKPPYHYLVDFNKISRKVMSIPQVWS